MAGSPSASAKKAIVETSTKSCKKVIDEIHIKFGGVIDDLCTNIHGQIREAEAEAKANEIALAILEERLKKVVIPKEVPTKLMTSEVLEKLESVAKDAKNLNKMVVAMDQSKEVWDIVAYFSLFPQHGELDAERLIDLWMAEKFCNSPKGGRRCLSQLDGNSMFQDVKKDEFGQVRSFKLHLLMHEIAELVEKHHHSIRENITIPNENQVHSKVQRASIDLSDSRLDPKQLYHQAKQLRSIFFFKEGTPQVDIDKILEKIFKNLKLRVLDLRNLGIEVVPSSIGDLKELEYLDLSQNKMKKLPSSIAKLSKLHTLKLFSCFDLTRMPCEMSKLSSLKTLSTFVASKKETMGGLGELAKLNDLRGNLEILHLDRVRCSSSTNGERKFLLAKEHLQRLTLSWTPKGNKEGGHLSQLLESLKPHSNLGSLILVGFPGSSLPGWLNSLTKLVKLSLQDFQKPHGCKLKYLSEQDNQLPPKLKILELENLENLEYITEKCIDGENFYKSLEEMTIKNCRKLESWRGTETEAGPLFEKISKLHLHNCTLKLLRLNTTSIPLKDLHIQYCRDLENLSGVFQHLSSLQRLTIENCDMSSLDGESKAWEGLKSLSCLTLRDIKHLSSLSFGDGVTTLQQLTLEKCHLLPSISIGKLTSLQELTLRNCDKLTSICIDKVASLRSLKISGCNKLESLPKTTEALNSLKTLHILDCALLQPRCVEPTGEDWPQICNIKYLKVGKTVH
ncbi:hypothetical protein AAZX31_09G191100 [Glycine max]